MQPHRGNHTALVKHDEYADDLEPNTYHKMVAKKIIQLRNPLSRVCLGDGKTKPETVIKHVDQLSKKMLALIQNKPAEAPLTSNANHFNPGNHIGCGGVDKVKPHSGQPCPTERNHARKQGENQKPEGITYKSDGKYKLEIRKEKP